MTRARARIGKLEAGGDLEAVFLRVKDEDTVGTQVPGNEEAASGIEEDLMGVRPILVRMGTGVSRDGHSLDQLERSCRTRHIPEVDRALTVRGPGHAGAVLVELEEYDTGGALALWTRLILFVLVSTLNSRVVALFSSTAYS